MVVIHNGTIINRGKRTVGYLVVQGERIVALGSGAFNCAALSPELQQKAAAAQMIDALGGYIMPGVIDD
ncbi:MAG: hypothetical protein RR499_06640, partial [Mucinivorans sp.]